MYKFVRDLIAASLQSGYFPRRASLGIGKFKIGIGGVLSRAVGGGRWSLNPRWIYDADFNCWDLQL
jgi:hypothetical protein